MAASRRNVGALVSVISTCCLVGSKAIDVVYVATSTPTQYGADDAVRLVRPEPSPEKPVALSLRHRSGLGATTRLTLLGHRHRSRGLMRSLPHVQELLDEGV